MPIGFDFSVDNTLPPSSVIQTTLDQRLSHFDLTKEALATDEMSFVLRLIRSEISDTYISMLVDTCACDTEQVLDNIRIAIRSIASLFEEGHKKVFLPILIPGHWCSVETTLQVDGTIHFVAVGFPQSILQQVLHFAKILPFWYFECCSHFFLTPLWIWWFVWMDASQEVVSNCLTCPYQLSFFLFVTIRNRSPFLTNFFLPMTFPARLPMISLCLQELSAVLFWSTLLCLNLRQLSVRVVLLGEDRVMMMFKWNLCKPNWPNQLSPSKMILLSTLIHGRQVPDRANGRTLSCQVTIPLLM